MICSVWMPARQHPTRALSNQLCVKLLICVQRLDRATSQYFSFNWRLEEAEWALAEFLSDSAFDFWARRTCGALARSKCASCWYLLSGAGLSGLSTYHSCQLEGLRGLKVVWLQWRLWKEQFVTQINEPVWYFVCKVWLDAAVTTETRAVVWHY